MDKLEVVYLDDMWSKVERGSEKVVRIEFRCEDILIMAFRYDARCGDEEEGYGCCGWEWNFDESEFFDFMSDGWLFSLNGYADWEGFDIQKVVNLLNEKGMTFELA